MRLPKLFSGAFTAVAALAATQAAATVQIESWSYSPEERGGGINLVSAGHSGWGPTGQFDLTLFETGNPGETFNLYTFCIDVLTGISSYSPYIHSSLADALANPLTSPQLTALTDTTRQSHLAALLTRANALIAAGASPAEQADIAAAIGVSVWEILYEESGSAYSLADGNFSIYGDFSSLIGLADSYLANVSSGTWTGSASSLRVLVAETAGGTQNQIYAAVPEPATWALMILGFGMIGAFMRRREGARTLATA